MRRYMKEMTTLAVLAVFGLSTIAFAGGGFRYNNSTGMEKNGWGSGGWGMCGYSQGNGNPSNLSTEQLSRLDIARTDFLRETENLRKSLCAKDQELRNELARENSDSARISGLKLEISNLQSELYQKSLDYDTRAGQTIPGYRGGFIGHCSMMGYTR